MSDDSKDTVFFGHKDEAYDLMHEMSMSSRTSEAAMGRLLKAQFDTFMDWADGEEKRETKQLDMLIACSEYAASMLVTLLINMVDEENLKQAAEKVVEIQNRAFIKKIDRVIGLSKKMG